MGKVYNTQDYLTIILSYTSDISADIASVKIKYVDPNGIEGEWDAIHNAEDKEIYYDVPLDSPLGIKGSWKVWSVATMVDGRTIPGTTSRFKINEEGR